MDVQTLVSTKLREGQLTSEESKVISMEAEKSKRENALKNQLEDAVVPDMERQRAGAQFSDSFDYNDVMLPPGYAIAQHGVFLKQEEWLRLTRTPFFIASRNRTHVQIMYLYRNEWLKEYVRPSCLKASTLANLFILPEPGVQTKLLVAYANAAAIYAPVVQGDDFIESVVQEIFNLLETTAFPTLIGVSQVIELCSSLNVKYEEVRKYLEIHGYIEQGPGKVKRARDNKTGITRPQRFLILQKPFKLSE